MKEEDREMVKEEEDREMMMNQSWEKVGREGERS